MLGCARKRHPKEEEVAQRSSSLLLVTPLLVHGCHYLTWCEPTAGSLWSLYQGKEGKESLTS